MRDDKPILDITSKVLSHYEEKCHCCGKLFLVQTRSLWAYKIKISETVRYFCGYPCWNKHKAKKDKQTKDNRDAYYDKLRANKKVTEKRRRDKKNGIT